MTLSCRYQRAAQGLLFSFLLLCLGLTGCAREDAVLQLSGFTMGTSYHVTVVDAAELDRAELQDELDRLLAAFSQISSTYIEDSELNQINRAPAAEWLDISETLSDILLIAHEISWLSGGAFDITVAPVVELWGFGAGGEVDAPPADAALEEAMQDVGFQHLNLDFGEPKLLKERAIQLDLSAIAKGYGVDIVALWLERRGLRNFLVEIGGEVVTRGLSPRGDAWRLAIEKPDAVGGIQQAIRVSGVAVATSGDYRNYFEKDGQRFSHTIDPRSGRPITHGLASVTVIHETAAYADALATALNVMGPERAMAFAERHEIAAYLIEKGDDGFVSRHSPTFANYLDSAQAGQ